VYRTRPWTVVLLVAMTALVAGFARLDSAHRPPPARAPAPQRPAEPPPRDAEPLYRYLDEMLEFLKETESARVTPLRLPPLDKLPPLPAELLPAEETAADLSPNPAARQRDPT
jgi:hypothetical protein